MGVIDGRGWPFFGRTFLWGGTPTKNSKVLSTTFCQQKDRNNINNNKISVITTPILTRLVSGININGSNKINNKMTLMCLDTIDINKVNCLLGKFRSFFLPFDYLIMWGGGDQLSPDNEEYWEGEEEGEDQARHGEAEGGFWEVVMYGLQGVHHADIPLHRQGDSHAHWHHQRTLSKTLCTGFIFKTC